MASSQRHTNSFLALMAVMTVLAGLIAIQSKQGKKPDPTVSAVQVSAKTEMADPEVVNGVHQPTGLAAVGDYQLVMANCISCHSANLITGNRMTAEGWRNTIEWMQETQKLWDLGPNTDKIVAYLANNYAPTETGRRKNLKIEPDDWYVLEN